MTFTTITLILLCLLTLIPLPLTEKIDLVEPSVSVFVKGQISEPSELTLHPSAQVKDVLNFVELLDNADISNLDLNQMIYDDMVITIDPKPVQVCISINQADQEQLESLPGIGTSTALKIIEYREEIGPFLVIEDILNVKNIGLKKFEKIKELICL